MCTFVHECGKVVGANACPTNVNAAHKIVQNHFYRLRKCYNWNNIFHITHRQILRGVHVFEVRISMKIISYVCAELGSKFNCPGSTTKKNVVFFLLYILSSYESLLSFSLILFQLKCTVFMDAWKPSWK